MQNCHLLDIKKSIYSNIYSQLRLVMPGKGKDRSSNGSTNNSLDEIKALLNENLMISVRNLFQYRRNLTPLSERYTSRWNR